MHLLPPDHVHSYCPNKAHDKLAIVREDSASDRPRHFVLVHNPELADLLRDQEVQEVWGDGSAPVAQARTIIL